jgi:tRNA pseudouridine38-40 synthase
MANFKLLISYKGTHFNGWQIQPNKQTIQGMIEKTVFDIFGEKARVVGSGRTDAGAHANGQVANIRLTRNITSIQLMNALNSKLPSDIRVKHAEIVDKSFHARFDAVGKTYMYCFYNSRTGNALIDEYSYQIPYEINLKRMQEAGNLLIGEHDFSSFCGKGSMTESNIRRIDELTFMKTGKIIVMTTTGNGFLYKMVRTIAGTLLEVGRGKLPPDIISELLTHKDREKGGPTAKAKGLSLLSVYYDKDEMKRSIEEQKNKKQLDTIVSLL